MKYEGGKAHISKITMSGHSVRKTMVRVAKQDCILLFTLTVDHIASFYQGISSRVSTSMNFPERVSRVAELMRSMIFLALSSPLVTGRSMPAPVAAAIPMSVKTNLCGEQ
jgi:hypothetical protein